MVKAARMAALLLTAAGIGRSAAPVAFQTHYLSLAPGDKLVAVAGDAAGNIFFSSFLASGLAIRIRRPIDAATLLLPTISLRRQAVLQVLLAQAA